MQTNQEPKARSEFEKAVELEPWFPEAHNNLGLILAKNSRLDEAVEHFRRASELKPDYLEAWFNLGLALRTANRLDNAVEAFRQAAKVAPDNAQVQYALGMTLKDKGDLAGARAALDRARALQQKGRNNRTRGRTNFAYSIESVRHPGRAASAGRAQVGKWLAMIGETPRARIRSRSYSSLSILVCLVAFAGCVWAQAPGTAIFTSQIRPALVHNCSVAITVRCARAGWMSPHGRGCCVAETAGRPSNWAMPKKACFIG